MIRKLARMNKITPYIELKHMETNTSPLKSALISPTPPELCVLQNESL